MRFHGLFAAELFVARVTLEVPHWKVHIHVSFKVGKSTQYLWTIYAAESALVLCVSSLVLQCGRFLFKLFITKITTITRLFVKPFLVRSQKGKIPQLCVALVTVIGENFVTFIQM